MSMTMKMSDFIREYRGVIDAQILAVTYRHDGNGGRGRIPDPPPRFNNEERRQWVLSDEPLYRMARHAGVRI